MALIIAAMVAKLAEASNIKIMPIGHGVVIIPIYRVLVYFCSLGILPV
jgi:hypothetical protein